MDDIEKTRQKYGDILYLQRPWPEETRRKHARMNIADRAKIFAPFAALSGHSARLALEDRRMLRTQRLEFSQEDTDRLSDLLHQLHKGMKVRVTYFVEDSSDMGYYSRLEGCVTSIDPVEQVLRIDSKSIQFKNLADISGEEIISFEDALNTFEGD